MLKLRAILSQLKAESKSPAQGILELELELFARLGLR